jgi:signal transduction histidine kinase
VTNHDNLLIETERIRAVFQQAPLTLLVNVANALLTAVVLVPVGNPAWLLIWLAAIVLVSGARWEVRQRFFHMTNRTLRKVWSYFSILGSLATGALWGFGTLLLSDVAETYQLFFAFVVGGMCAGSTAVNSAHMPTVLAFVLPASLPLAGRFLIEGSAPWVVAGLMTLVFTAALSVTSFRVHCGFGERFRLQLALGRQERKLTEANARLRTEIAERQEAEATLHQSQKMEAIGHLTGGLAHDFNNLLQIVNGNLGMIERLATDNAQLLGYVHAAEQAIQQGARLTGSLLAFARRQALQVERLNLNTLLQEFQPILQRAIDGSIRFQTLLAPDLPDCDVDPAQFQSAILNVVINARDAMPEGGQLSIATGVAIVGNDNAEKPADVSPGSFVTVVVRDSGTGMTADVVARVYEPFFTTKEVGKGSGLGLSQVYGFARQSGGFVSLNSRPDVGTSVTLYLPSAQP